MKSNFRWHHVGAPDNELPEPGNDLIVRCANRKYLIVDNGLCTRAKFDLAHYDEEDKEFWTTEGDSIIVFKNVAAWCYIKDVYDQLNNTGWGFDPDREANNG